MDETTARFLLEKMVAMKVEPVLSPEELDQALALSRVADELDRGITETDYVPTWDLNRAAALCWQWKMGKVSSTVNATTDGQTISAGDLFKHCEAMMKLYRNKIVASVPIPTEEKLRADLLNELPTA